MELSIDLLKRLPRLSTGWDRDKEIELFKRKHPYWKYSDMGAVFFATNEPLSDPIAELKLAIAEFVTEEDIVATPPEEVAIFAESNAGKIEVFDISLKHLVSLAVKAIFIGGNKIGKKTWWIDVADQEMLREMLNDTNTSILYLSNIVGWLSIKKIPAICQTIQESNVKCIVFSYLGLDTAKVCNKMLVSYFTGKGWTEKIFPSSDSSSKEIHVLVAPD